MLRLTEYNAVKRNIPGTESYQKPRNRHAHGECRDQSPPIA
jgi:hypothetical protein